MTFLHWKIPGSSGDVARVQTDIPANIRLLDALNFEYYKKGSKFEGEGGWSDKLIVEFVLPYKGTFHVVVDLAGQAGTVKATCDMTRR